MNKYKETIRQAINRLYYFDEVYVAFPHNYAKYVKDKYNDNLINFSIGLISVNSRVDILIKAKPSKYLNLNRKQKMLTKLKTIQKMKEDENH